MRQRPLPPSIPSLHPSPSPAPGRPRRLLPRLVPALLLLVLLAPAAAAPSFAGVMPAVAEAGSAPPPMPQAPPAPPAAAPDDPIAQQLFPPDLIMKHGGDIGLDAQQRGAIRDAVKQAQSKFLDAQWEMQEQTGRMVQLLRARPVDENAVLAELDHVLDLERQIKRTQIALLVRLKNLLSPTQQARLADFRRAGE